MALLLVATLWMTAGCSGSDPVAGKTPTEQLAAAKVTFDAATSVHLTLRSSGIPESANGVLGADGSGTNTPAFKGTIDARISGFGAKVEVVAVDKVLYLKLPFTTDFVPADPKEYNAPDPAQLFAKQGGISSLLTQTQNPAEGKKIRVGPDVLQTITGTLPGASVSNLLSVGDTTKTFTVIYGLTESSGELRTVTVTGPFFKGPAGTYVTSTYTLTLDNYGAQVEISKP
jgi:lipoprotein LprG